MNRMVNGEPCGAGLIPDRKKTLKKESIACALETRSDRIWLKLKVYTEE